MSNCIGCGMCAKNCAHSAISLTEKKASIDHRNVLDVVDVSAFVLWMLLCLLGMSLMKS